MTWRWGRAQALLGVMLLLGSPSLAEVYHIDEIYNISVGHAMRLPCDGAESDENVMWRRKGGLPLDPDAGMEVRGNAIWFLPAQANHSGVYVCNGTNDFHIQLNVASGSCPEADFEVDRTLHTSGILNSRMKHISNFINATSITWLKECKPLERDHSFITPTRLRLNSLEKTDAGNYTCVLRFSREGRNYTFARTTRLVVHVIIEPSKPLIIIPTDETRVVEMGSRQELRCEVISDEITSVMWKTPDSHSDFNISYQVDIEGRQVAILTIFEVQPKFLNVPLICVAQNSMGITRGQIVLTQANHRGYYWLVVVGSLCGLVMLAVLLYRFFKLDLVLFYRSHCPRLHQRSDGKQYDAYVCYPCEGQGVSMAMTFALRILPEVLEEKHGYKLFIRGRDDSLGEEVFDVIEDALKKSRRFVVVLDGDTHTATNAPTHTEPNTHTHTHTHKATRALTHNETDTHTHADRETNTSISAETTTGTDGPMLLDTLTHTVPQAESSVCVEGFEQSVGLFDALVCSGPKVIVIQTGQEEIPLPPSLSLHTHSKRALRWRADTHTHSQKRFWKKLRYLMPVAQRPSHKPYLA